MPFTERKDPSALMADAVRRSWARAWQRVPQNATIFLENPAAAVIHTV